MLPAIHLNAAADATICATVLRSMRASGVIADIIVFHPYDGGQWGFDCMGGTDPNHYNTSNDERCKCSRSLCVFFPPL